MHNQATSYTTVVHWRYIAAGLDNWMIENHPDRQPDTTRAAQLGNWAIENCPVVQPDAKTQESCPVRQLGRVANIIKNYLFKQSTSLKGFANAFKVIYEVAKSLCSNSSL